jgi:hypothetical protein
MLVTAIQRFHVGERWVEPDESAEVTNRYGLALIEHGRAKEAVQPSPSPPCPAVESTFIPAVWELAPVLPTIFPNLRPFFKHAEWKPRPYSKGAVVGSDFMDKDLNDPIFGVYRHCGFWTVDEVKILFAIARTIGGYWLDIGGLTGWTAAHLALAGCSVASLDPMYSNPDFRARAVENLSACKCFRRVGLWVGTSEDILRWCSRLFSGIVIDGDHDAPHPLEDATLASTRTTPNGVILLHDANKPVVMEGVKYLTDAGWKARYYNTCHGVSVCYRDGFTPPAP